MHGLQDGILGMFGFVAYRCRACRGRFHRKPPGEHEEEEIIESETEEAREKASDVDTAR
jgi:hypothetical protein